MSRKVLDMIVEEHSLSNRNLIRVFARKGFLGCYMYAFIVRRSVKTKSFTRDSLCICVSYLVSRKRILSKCCVTINYKVKVSKLVATLIITSKIHHPTKPAINSGRIHFSP